VADTMRKNTDAIVRGGAAHSSVETSVMEAERRGSVIPADRTGQPGNGEEPVVPAKPFSIAKAGVWRTVLGMPAAG
jgi:RNA-directed DNA polymerase